MPTVKLTDRKLQSLKPPPQKRQEEFYDSEFKSGSFGLLVGREKKSFFLIYRNQAGKKQRIKLGQYPVISLTEARNKALASLGRVAEGEDPAQEKSDYNKAETVSDIVPVFINRFVTEKKLSTQREYIRILKIYILPYWKQRKLVDIKRSDVIALIDKIAETSPVMSNRVRSLLSKLFKFAIIRNLLEHNPVYLTQVYKEKRNRQRILSDSEIKIFWEKCSELEDSVGDLFKLTLLTGQRTGEVKGMRWQDINSDTWTNPRELSKNGRENIVPLCPAALEILNKLSEEGEKHKNKTKHEGFIKSIPKYVFYSDTGGHIEWLQKAAHRLNISCEFKEKFTPHDLRRTAATGFGRLGVRSEIISKILNHKTPENVVTARYNLYDALKEKRLALSKWAKHVDAAIKDKLETQKIIPFKRSANG